MLSALLAFQFDRESLRRSENRRRFIRLIWIIGIIVAATVITVLLGCIIWLQERGN